MHRTTNILSTIVWHAFKHKYPFVFELSALWTQWFHVIPERWMGTKYRWVRSTVQHRIDEWRRTTLAKEFVLCLLVGVARPRQGGADAEKRTIFHRKRRRRRIGANSRQRHSQHYWVSLGTMKTTESIELADSFTCYRVIRVDEINNNQLTESIFGQLITTQRITEQQV